MKVRRRLKRKRPSMRKSEIIVLEHEARLRTGESATPFGVDPRSARMVAQVAGHVRFHKLGAFDLIVCGLQPYCAGLSELIDIRQIKSIIVAYADRKWISTRPLNLALVDADGDIRLQIGFCQLDDQCINFGGVGAPAVAD